MANIMLEILDGFYSAWVLLYQDSKSSVLKVTLNFEFE